MQTPSRELVTVGDASLTDALFRLLSCTPAGSRIEAQTDRSAYRAVRVGEVGVACVVDSEDSVVEVDSWIACLEAVARAPAACRARP